MSTRALISVERENGMWETIYCHHDGYPGWVGRVLLEHYNEKDKVNSLVAMGHLSTLAETTEKCEAYHRDAEDPWEACCPIATNTLYEALILDMCQEFHYIKPLGNPWQMLLNGRDGPVVAVADYLARVDTEEDTEDDDGN